MEDQFRPPTDRGYLSAGAPEDDDAHVVSDVAPDVITDTVHSSYDQFAGSRVRDFVPVLVERIANSTPEHWYHPADSVVAERLWEALSHARAKERQNQVADLEDAVFRQAGVLSRRWAHVPPSHVV